MKTITIFGASGRQGLSQIKVALNHGFHVRAVTRRPDSFSLNPTDHLSIIRADYHDEASLKPACEGAFAVFLTPTSFTDSFKNSGKIVSVAQAAQAAGVNRLVLNTSMYVPNSPIGEPIYDGRLNLENALEATGVPLTVFRPVLFMDNLLTDWVKPQLISENIFLYPHNLNMRASWISLDNVAEFMVKSLESEKLVGKRFVIGGPDVLKPKDVAEILSGVLNRPIKFEQSTPLEFAKLINGIFSNVLDLPPDLHIKMISDFYAYNNASDKSPMAVDMNPVLTLLPVKLMSLKDWALNQNWSLRRDDETAPLGG